MLQTHICLSCAINGVVFTKHSSDVWHCVSLLSCLRQLFILIARSGFGSPSSPTALPANPPPPSQHDSLFAFGSGSNAHASQLQHQQMQAPPPPGFGAMHNSGGHSHQGKAPPLGSGRGLETMPEDDDTMVRCMAFWWAPSALMLRCVLLTVLCQHIVL